MRSRPRLSRRLHGVLSLVPLEARSVADIGAGHGALASHIAATRRVKVVATEAAAGPYAELCHNLADWDTAAAVEVRRGAGLSVLEPGEVEAVVVAGLSARTVIGVCEQAAGKRVRWMVIQCAQRPDQMERWLCDQRWIVRRVLEVEERRRRYPTWLVEVPG